MRIAPPELKSLLSPGELQGCAPAQPIDPRRLAAIQEHLERGQVTVPDQDLADAMLDDAHFLERWLK